MGCTLSSCRDARCHFGLVFFNFGSVFDLPPGGEKRMKRRREEEEGRGEKKIMNGLLSLISFSSVPDYAPCSFVSFHSSLPFSFQDTLK